MRQMLIETEGESKMKTAIVLVAAMAWTTGCAGDVSSTFLNQTDAAPECFCRSCSGPVAVVPAGQVECIYGTYAVYACACPGSFDADSGVY